MGGRAEHLACLDVPDISAVPVLLSRVSVMRRRAGLSDRRGCHESGKGDGPD
jgi:hypothetical protein